MLLQQQRDDEDIAPLFPYVKTKEAIPESLKKTVSQRCRILMGLKDSLQLDEWGLIRYQLPLNMTPFEEECSVLVLPQKLISEAIRRAHTQLAHQAAKETYNKLRLHAYFPYMIEEIRKQLLLCHECQTKTTRLPNQKHSLASTVPGYPFQILSLDFVGPLPPSRAHKFQYLLTLKCTFTEWLKSFPIKQANAETVICLLYTSPSPRD